MKTAQTFTANIFVGLREGYDGPISGIEAVKAILQSYVNEVGFCVSLTETTFIYKDGSEPGVIVGIINYPRFPSTESALRDKALHIASLLKVGLKQFRVSVVFDTETVMLEV